MVAIRVNMSIGVVAPTGRAVTAAGIGIYRIAGGKIAEEWLNWDTLGLMQQLGVIPAE